MSFEKVTIIGLGYIGLPTAAMFASRKVKVRGVDIDQNTVDTINRGEIHIVEPDLDMLVHAAVVEGYLEASVTPESSDAFIIAVPTPFKSSNKTRIPEPDLSYIKKACAAIAPVLKKGDLVILESTSPVGATEKMLNWLSNARNDLIFPKEGCNSADIYIAHCPERVLPGHIVRELVENDRVIGGISERCSKRAVDLYKIFVTGDCVVTNARTAEMAKLTENSCRDVQIAFANELSIICDELNINVWELISLANRHPRIDILKPGPGVGGHCIAVDPWFIVDSAPELSNLIYTARMVNDKKPDWVVNKVKLAIADFLNNNPDKIISDVSIACYGIAFKADIDDLRESPALKILMDLLAYHKGRITVVEPNINKLPNFIDGAKLLTTEEALSSCDIHLLLVDHKEFISRKPTSKYIVDTKGVW